MRSPKKQAFRPSTSRSTIWCPAVWPPVRWQWTPGRSRCRRRAARSGRFAQAGRGRPRRSPRRCARWDGWPPPSRPAARGTGRWEGRGQRARGCRVGRAPGVVEVQVAEDHVVDVAGFEAVAAELLEKAPGLHRELVLEFLGVLQAEAGIDDDVLAAGADERAVDVEGDAVALVGRHPTLPQRPGHDAEVGAAVNPHRAVNQEVESQIADAHGFPPPFLPL